MHSSEYLEKHWDDPSLDVRWCDNCGKACSSWDMEWTYDCQGIPFQHVCPACYDKLMGKGYDGQYYDERDENLQEEY